MGNVKGKKCRGSQGSFNIQNPENLGSKQNGKSSHQSLSNCKCNVYISDLYVCVCVCVCGAHFEFDRT